MDEDAIRLRLKESRNRNGLTQKEMAEELGIDRNTYSNIERGSTALVCRHLERIAELLHTTEEELLLGYKPCRPGDKDSLDDVRIQYQEKLDNAKDGYEDKLASANKLLATYEEMIRMLRAQNEEQKLEISMLKKNKRR